MFWPLQNILVLTRKKPRWDKVTFGLSIIFNQEAVYQGEIVKSLAISPSYHYRTFNRTSYLLSECYFFCSKSFYCGI